MIELPLLIDFFLGFNGFVVTTLIVVAIIGLISRSMTVAVFGVWLVFVEIAVATGNQFFTNILMVVLVLAAVGTSFKIWAREGPGVE